MIIGLLQTHTTLRRRVKVFVKMGPQAWSSMHGRIQNLGQEHKHQRIIRKYKQGFKMVLQAVKHIGANMHKVPASFVFLRSSFLTANDVLQFVVYYPMIE